jgi:hypothetical protein
MSTFGGIFSDYLNLPWEQARTFVAEEFEQLRLAISRQWAVAFNDDGTLTGDAIGGNKTIVPQYVSNTGLHFKPTWDKVNVATGVKSRLAYNHFTQATTNSVLLGRGELFGGGDWQQIALGVGLDMTNLTLSATGSSVSYIPLATGVEPLTFISDGLGHPVLVPFVP